MAYKDLEKEKAYRAYYEKHIRSEASKKRKAETTKLWIARQRKLRDEQELKNGEELGYPGVKIKNIIRKRIEEGTTKILVNNDSSIMCFHKNEDGHWVNNTNGKKYLHREVIKQAYNLADEDLKGKIIHHINENKDDNRPENLEIITQKEHMTRHKEQYSKNLALGRGNNRRTLL